MVASVGAGVLLSAFRSFILEDLTGWAKPKTGSQAKRATVEAAYQSLLRDHYDYYKCYGNTAVALVAFTLCYLWTNAGALTFAGWLRWIVGAVLVVAMLTWKSLDCIHRFESKRGDLLDWPKEA